jgi:hypothetical protein
MAADSASPIGAWPGIAVTFLLQFAKSVSQSPGGFAVVGSPNAPWSLRGMERQTEGRWQGAPTSRLLGQGRRGPEPGGVERKILSDHVIAATGYKVDLARLTFLNAKLRPMIKSVQSTPVLSSTFESSVPGLYFVGIAAANSFGPLMRFAFGACFAARCLTRAIEKSLEREPVSVPSGSAEPPQPTVYVEAARNDEMQSTLR